MDDMFEMNEMNDMDDMYEINEINVKNDINDLGDMDEMDNTFEHETVVGCLCQIAFELNGEAVIWNGSPALSLLDALRSLGDKGVKCGCREGECGACAVILDGKLVNSCMTAMGRVAGSTVTTILGYKKTARFAALSEAFASVSAVQCGFCIPGMIMAAECLLSENPNPSNEQIRIGISGNLCRCTGYNAIVSAIASAAREGKGLW